MTTMTDTTNFVATKPCILDPNTFHDRAAFQYILNRNFFDQQRSKPEEGFYVVDCKLMGVRTIEQEYAVYSFMRDEFEELVDLEYEDIHSKTLYFKVDGSLLAVGVYDLEHDEMIAHYLWDMDEVYDLNFSGFGVAG